MQIVIGTPTTTTTTTTLPTTTTSTTTTTTMPLTAPIAFNDFVTGVVGEPISLDVLFFDILGDPPAVITSTTFDGSAFECEGLSFDTATGMLTGAPVNAVTCRFVYVLTNAAGSDSASVTVAFE